MTEIGESVSLSFAKAHKSKSADCPFCPEEPPEKWTTHPGSANKSSALAAVMAKPSALPDRQSGARPKNGEPNRQREDRPEPKPVHPAKAIDPCSFEAHHLISGKQALKGNAIEAWIDASAEGSKVDADSGYSVNNGRNGIWLPSVPERLVSKGFGALSDKQKYELATVAMDLWGGQFHKGPHHVVPDESADEKHADCYDGYLKKVLQELADRIDDWAKVCVLCAKSRDAKKKPRPSVRVNKYLDDFSDIVRKKVTGEPALWHIFISKLAYWYHLEKLRERGAKFVDGQYTPVAM